MKQRILKLLTVGMTLLSLVGEVFAQNEINVTGCEDVPELSGLMKIVNNIRNLLISIGVAFAAIMGGLGGIKIITSEGEAEKMEEGKRQLMFALIGLVIVFIAFALARAMKAILCKPY
jgi:hypothetical protein